MKIAIMGSIANPNVGDEAICLSALRNIDKIAKPSDEVYIFTKDCSYTMILCKEFKFKVIPIDIIHKYIWKFEFEESALKQAHDEFIDDKFKIDKYEFEKISVHEIFKNIDVLHIIGGGYINSYWLDILYEVRICVDLAHKYKKRIIFTGQTIGPISNENGHELIDMFDKAHVIDLRDDNLFEYVNDSKAKIVQVTLDDAIYFKAKKNTKLPIDIQKKYINICIQNWNGYNDIIEKKIHEEIIPFIDELIDKDDIQINILEFNHYDKDIEIGKKIFNGVKVKSQRNIYLMNLSQFSPEITQKILAEALFNIGTRFHMAVFSLASRVPVLSFYTDEYYKIKIKGIHDTFNSKTFLSISDLTKKDLDYFVENIEFNKSILDTNLHKIKKLYNKKMYWLARMYGNTKLKKIINYIRLIK